MTINVALAGAGAFGIKHLDAINLIDGVKVISLVGRERAKTEEVARKYGIPHVTTDLADSLKMKAGRRRHPVHAHADARGAGARLPRRRQTRAGRDPALRQARRRAGGGRRRQGERPESRCAATPAASTRATSGCASGS